MRQNAVSFSHKLNHINCLFVLANTSFTLVPEKTTKINFLSVESKHFIAKLQRGLGMLQKEKINDGILYIVVNA